jgi:cytochrome c2
MRRLGLLAAAPLLALALAAAETAPAGDPVKGEEVYQDRCIFCHLQEGQGQGPNLHGVVGRKAASLPDFPYSQALVQSGLSWDTPTLDRFLQGPQDLVPGTAMPMTVPDPKERADLIAYLNAQK